MNQEFKRLIESLSPAARGYLLAIHDNPLSAPWVAPNLLLALCAKKLVIVSDKAELTERGRRVVDHLDYLARKS